MMEQFILEQTGKEPIAFAGELLGMVQVDGERGSGHYSGHDGISYTAKLYRTEAQKYVLECTTYSIYTDCKKETFVYLADTRDKMIEVIRASITSRAATWLINRLLGTVHTG
jgi:hypothetical protein